MSGLRLVWPETQKPTPGYLSSFSVELISNRRCRGGCSGLTGCPLIGGPSVGWSFVQQRTDSLCAFLRRRPVVFTRRLVTAPLSQQDGGKMRAKPVGFSRARFRLGHKPHRLSITALGARASPSGLWNVLRVSWVLTEDGRRLGVDQVMAQLAALAMLTALRM